MGGCGSTVTISADAKPGVYVLTATSTENPAVKAATTLTVSGVILNASDVISSVGRTGPNELK